MHRLADGRPAARAAARRRFDQAKFGLFVHWGLDAIGMPPGLEAPDEHDAFRHRFTAERFDAAAWVDIARDAGQRYLVFTAKQRDGFAMFDTATTDHNSTTSPFGRDVVAELAAACAAGRVGFGPYFAAPDLHDPGYRSGSAGFLDRMATQVEELCTRYGELFTWWWDDGTGRQWPVERLHRLVRDHQPRALVNDRLGGLAPGAASELAADFLTSAPPVPDTDDPVPWEARVALGDPWPWEPELPRCRTGAEAITELVEVASRGGNLLLCVGARGDGKIEPELQQTLREVGRWLEVHGGAIHGTTYGPVQGHPDLRSTADADHIYLHVVPSAPGRIRIPGAAGVTSASTATSLATGAEVRIEHAPPDLYVDLGRIPRHRVMTTIRVAR